MLWGQAPLWSSVVDCMLPVGLSHTIDSITLIKLTCDKTVSFHWIALEFECCHWLRGVFLGVVFGYFYFLEGLRRHLAIPRRILIFMRNGFGTLTCLSGVVLVWNPILLIFCFAGVMPTKFVFSDTSQHRSPFDFPRRNTCGLYTVRYPLWPIKNSAQ